MFVFMFVGTFSRSRIPCTYFPIDCEFVIIWIICNSIIFPISSLSFPTIEIYSPPTKPSIAIVVRVISITIYFPLVEYIFKSWSSTSKKSRCQHYVNECNCWKIFFFIFIDYQSSLY